jgi:hypothetical protein
LITKNTGAIQSTDQTKIKKEPRLEQANLNFNTEVGIAEISGGRSYRNAVFPRASDKPKTALPRSIVVTRSSRVSKQYSGGMFSGPFTRCVCGEWVPERALEAHLIAATSIKTIQKHAIAAAKEIRRENSTIEDAS